MPDRSTVIRRARNPWLGFFPGHAELNEPNLSHRFVSVRLPNFVLFPRTALLRVAALMAGLVVVSGCGVSADSEASKKPPDAVPQLVGRVASIPPGKSFLLIETFGEWRVADGAILITRGADERSANLLVTGERLGQFAAADIQAGQAQVGDAVMLLPAPPAKIEPPAEEEPAPIKDAE